MNKTETRTLWNALCACTCKPGAKAPLDCVCVHDKIVYATNSYVLHRVEGLFQPGSVFKALFGHSCAYADRVDFLDALLEHDPVKREFDCLCPYYDPAYLALALRPHKAIGAKNLQLYTPRKRENGPLIMTSSVATPHEPIIITTAVQGLRRG